MPNSVRPTLKVFILVVSLSLQFSVYAEIIDLSGTLGAANQNGSDPARVTDPLGVVPTTASGDIQIQLDDTNNLLNLQLSVDGILQNELRSFGPNATPFHLHLAGGADPGNFGSIAIDMALGSTPANFTDTATGFSFERNDLSILVEDQGNVALGMHPGNDQIADSLLSGNMFVLIHTTKDIFLNNTGPVPGFPFGEIRGNININASASPVPEPAVLSLIGTGMMLLALMNFARRRA